MTDPTANTSLEAAFRLGREHSLRGEGRANPHDVRTNAGAWRAYLEGYASGLKDLVRDNAAMSNNP